MEKREAKGLFPFKLEAHVHQLWATLPPFDVAKLRDNEGISYSGNISLYSPRNPSPYPSKGASLSIDTQKR